MSRAFRTMRSSAAVAVQTPVRCAIYTRKSTDEGLDRDFNTLDAQRDAAEKYISSQEADGWSALPDRFDDGGFTGANTNRPAFQRLLRDIEARKVDCVVVYKYDRLSRSMLDFLQMLDFFKRHGVSFVSVSQRFDTSTPVGEVTLNILLSFAQFERQMIAERTRDKMHAARRRGRWTGGMPPLGFDTVPEGGRIIVNKDEADQVRAIFDLYLELGSLLAVAQELTRRGWRRKSWTTKDGKPRAGKAWDKTILVGVLRNPLYAGLQRLGREVFPGEHGAIVARKTWDRVQRLLDSNRNSAGAAQRNSHGALLRGLLRCSACDAAMIHTWTRHRGRTFRYYRCTAAMKRGHGTCPTRSVPAQRIEDFVVGQIRRIGADPALCDEVFKQVHQQVAAERRGLKAEAKRLNRELATLNTDDVDRGDVAERRRREIAAREAALAVQDVSPETVGRALADFDSLWEVLTAPERERVLNLLIERVTYDGATKQLTIDYKPAGIATLAADAASAESTS